MKIAVILPMYNESDNAPLILEKIEEVRKNNNLELEVIAVNDGSKDGTLEVLEKLENKFPILVVADHGVNKGMAEALKTGIRVALERKKELLFFMDSDLTHSPEDFPKFIKKINEGYDFVIGSRFIRGGGMIGVPAFRVLFSKFGNLFGRLLLGLPITDLTSGFRSIKAGVFRKIALEEKGFPIQLEETVKTFASGFKMSEVPIILTTRKFGKSSMVYDLNLIKNYANLLVKCFRWLKND